MEIVIIAIPLSLIAYSAYREYKIRLKRIEKMAELGRKIERRIEFLKRDNINYIVEFFKTGKTDPIIEKILHEENKDLEEMIKRYEKM